MNRNIVKIALLLGLAGFACSCAKEPQTQGYDKKKAAQEPQQQVEPVKHHIFVGYVTYWDTVMPPLQYVTHINYAFGKVANTFDAVTIKTPSRLQKIVKERNEKYPDVKVLLSIGGWGAGNFSEMAADSLKRMKFCKSCLSACQNYGLDGIDMDWEYPTSSSAGISSSKDDTKNFTKLMRDLRATLGDDLLLTMASSSSARYVDFRKCIQYMDFVNIMTYDMGDPPQHNAALYPSNMTHRSCDESVQLHISAGVPREKIVLGVAFFGRKLNADDSPDYWEIEKEFGKYTRKWDDKAKVPYLVDGSGKMQITYDDSLSVHLKGEYAVEKNLPGVMVWSLEGDNWSTWVLSRSLCDAVHSKDED
ncbi:MAG: glycosyl hydrolase family 18 protein [Bacteroidales bacterium]|nr:glycosyl hydrolase family 18 protein [Bacteroidales bacterium]